MLDGLRLWEVRRESARHVLALIRSVTEGDALALARSEFGPEATVRLARNRRAPRGFRLLGQPADGLWPDRLTLRIPLPW